MEVNWKENHTSLSMISWRQTPIESTFFNLWLPYRTIHLPLGSERPFIIIHDNIDFPQKYLYSCPLKNISNHYLIHRSPARWRCAYKKRIYGVESWGSLTEAAVSCCMLYWVILIMVDPVSLHSSLQLNFIQANIKIRHKKIRLIPKGKLLLWIPCERVQ